MSLKSRFESRDALIEGLRAQKVIQGDVEVATGIAEVGELVEFAPGQNLIVQGATDRDMYFILAGKASVIVKGSRLYPREKNLTVGEMSALNPEILRSATLEADETTVAWKITHEQLEIIATKHPRLWKLLAVDLAGRLEQRNQLISGPNARPRVFFICSAEALQIAECIRAGLDHEDATIEIWSDEQIFPAGSYPIEALERAVDDADFGIAIAQPDDLIRSRDRQAAVSRLGRKRTLLLVPKESNVQLPSDFKGLTPLNYKAASKHENLSTALGPTIYRIKEILKEHGVRKDL
jgi:CRP/FNR family transcriptional regulator, cyclic AMP receptor protein